MNQMAAAPEHMAAKPIVAHFICCHRFEFGCISNIDRTIRWVAIAGMLTGMDITLAQRL